MKRTADAPDRAARSGGHSNEATQVLAAVLRGETPPGGDGHAILPAVARQLEPVLGASLADVRVHNDEASAATARLLGARAFAAGRHIWLGEGVSPADVGLMGHEAAHVVQQTGGSARPGPRDRRGLEAAAREAGARAAAGPSRGDPVPAGHISEGPAAATVGAVRGSAGVGPAVLGSAGLGVQKDGEASSEMLVPQVVYVPGGADVIVSGHVVATVQGAAVSDVHAQAYRTASPHSEQNSVLIVHISHPQGSTIETRHMDATGLAAANLDVEVVAEAYPTVNPEYAERPLFLNPEAAPLPETARTSPTPTATASPPPTLPAPPRRETPAGRSPPPAPEPTSSPYRRSLEDRMRQIEDDLASGSFPPEVVEEMQAERDRLIDELQAPAGPRDLDDSELDAETAARRDWLLDQSSSSEEAERTGAELQQLEAIVGERNPRRRPGPPSSQERAPGDDDDSGVLDWVVGTIGGEFTRDPSISQIITDTGITLIPVVDQVGDVRDVVAHLYYMIGEGEYDSVMRWVAVVITLIGLIPEAGTAIKGVMKLILKGGGEALGAIGDILRLARRYFPDVPDLAGFRRWALARWPAWKDFVRERWLAELADMERKLSALPEALAGDALRKLREIRDLSDEMLAKAFEAIRDRFDEMFPSRAMTPEGIPMPVPHRAEPMQMSSLGGSGGGRRPTVDELMGRDRTLGESIDELEETVTRGTGTRDPRETGWFSESGTAMEPGSVAEWADELGAAWQVTRRAEWEPWLRRLFRRANEGPDMVAINRADRRILVGDIAPNPGSRVDVRGGTGHGPPARQRRGPGSETTRAGDEGTRFHMEKTIEYGERIAANLPEELRDFAVYVQERYWEHGRPMSRLIRIPSGR